MLRDRLEAMPAPGCCILFKKGEEIAPYPIAAASVAVFIVLIFFQPCFMPLPALPRSGTRMKID